jgi:hypothetical protein
MKTTVEIPDALFEEVKKASRKRGLTFRAFLEESIRKNLHRQPQRPFRLRKHTFGGKGLTPGMDWKAIRQQIYKGRGE